MNEWRPIDTAPKDGSHIDLWAIFETGARRVADAYWSDKTNDWKLGGFSSRQYAAVPQITHWMPLPEPPNV